MDNQEIFESLTIENKKKSIIYIILEAMVIPLITSITFLLLAYINIEDITITVSQSVLQENEYHTIFTINNNKEEKYENIELIVKNNEVLR